MFLLIPVRTYKGHKEVCLPVPNSSEIVMWVVCIRTNGHNIYIGLSGNLKLVIWTRKNHFGHLGS